MRKRQRKKNERSRESWESAAVRWTRRLVDLVNNVDANGGGEFIVGPIETLTIFQDGRVQFEVKKEKAE